MHTAIIRSAFAKPKTRLRTKISIQRILPNPPTMPVTAATTAPTDPPTPHHELNSAAIEHNTKLAMPTAYTEVSYLQNTDWAPKRTNWNSANTPVAMASDGRTVFICCFAALFKHYKNSRVQRQVIQSKNSWRALSTRRSGAATTTTRADAMRCNLDV